MCTTSGKFDYAKTHILLRDPSNKGSMLTNSLRQWVHTLHRLHTFTVSKGCVLSWWPPVPSTVNNTFHLSVKAVAQASSSTTHHHWHTEHTEKTGTEQKMCEAAWPSWLTLAALPIQGYVFIAQSKMKTRQKGAQYARNLCVMRYDASTGMIPSIFFDSTTSPSLCHYSLVNIVMQK